MTNSSSLSLLLTVIPVYLFIITKIVQGIRSKAASIVLLGGQDQENPDFLASCFLFLNIVDRFKHLTPLVSKRPCGNVLTIPLQHIIIIKGYSLNGVKLKLTGSFSETNNFVLPKISKSKT